jgi:drug/metabolite transporter (DMT)-like permease
LGEIIPWYGYIGIIFTIVGALIITLRLKTLKTSSKISYFIALIFIIGLAEFMVNASVTYMNEWNAFALASFVEGIITCFVIFKKDALKNFRLELRNTHWLLIGEIFTFFALGTLYLTMSGMQAGIVSALSTVQVIFVLFIEWMFNLFIGNISRDNVLSSKLYAIILIFLGVLLLTL